MLRFAVVFTALAAVAFAAPGTWTTLSAICSKDGIPASDNSQLASHGKSSLLENLADGGDVTSFHTFSASGATRPQVKRNQVNGYHALRFSQVESDKMAWTDGASGTEYTSFVVYRLNADSALGDTARQSVTGMDNSAYCYAQKDGKVGVMADSTATASSGVLFNQADWHIMVCMKFGGSAPAAGYASTPANKQIVYVDGTAGAPIESSKTSQAAVSGAAATTAANTHFIGTTGSDKFDGDIAEHLVYKKALSLMDIDRVGTYLAKKFGLTWNRQPGSGASESDLTTNAIKVGDKDDSLHIRMGGSGLAAGGNVVTITGTKLAPADNGQTANIETLQPTLKVTMGQLPAECRNSKVSEPCTTSSLSLPEATNCVIWEYPTCTPASDVGGCQATIQCRAPAGLGPGADIAIHWQGVPYVLHNWYHYQDPVVTSVVPNKFSYSGGSKITVNGKNFGPKETWTATTPGDATTSMTRTANVEILTRVGQRCTNVQWVSDAQLVCTVPAIAKAKHSVDTTKREMAATVVVDAKGARSAAWAAGAAVHYSTVPSYYTCENSGTDALSKSDCYSCCRHACVTEEFALGTQKGGATYAHCDTQCVSYCGFLSTRRRALLSVMKERLMKLMRL